MKPWSGGVTAGIILSIALLIQTKLLFPKEEQFKQKFIYCALYLASCQFAYMLPYSILIEGFALSILFASLSCYLFYEPTLRSAYRYTLAATCLLVALACYQTSGLVFFALTCCKLITLEQNQRLLKNLLLFEGMSIVSISLFFVIKFGIHTLYQPCHEAMEFVKAHESSHINSGILNPNANYYELIINRFTVALQCNIYIILSTLIAIGILTVRFICNKKWSSLGILAIAVTGTLCAVLLTGANPCMYFFLPVYTSFIIVYAMSGLKMHPYTRRCGYALLGLFCIYAAHKVAGMALKERTRHENHLMEMFAQYQEARKLHYDNIDLKNTPINIIVFEPGWNEKAPNFYNSYPFPNFNLGTWLDYEKHKEALEAMPLWPATGSIREHKGDIIIKSSTR